MRLADALVCVFVCLQDWITAKVGPLMGQFHWNLVLWIGPTSRKHLKLLVVARSWIWIPVTFFLFHHCRIRHFTKIYQHNFSHSHGLTAAFHETRPDDRLVSWAREWIHNILTAIRRADTQIHIRIRINPEIQIRIPDYFWLRFGEMIGRWRRSAVSDCVLFYLLRG